nr:unnamed protein product [Trichobilharzia regenti]
MFDSYARRFNVFTEIIEPDPTPKHGIKHIPQKSLYADTTRFRRLTTKQKCLIAHVELEEFKNTINRAKDQLESELLQYTSVLETFNLDLKDIESRRCALKTVMRKGYCLRLGTYTAEALIQNHEKNMINMSAEIENLKMKSIILTQERRKLKALLRTRSGKSNALQEVEIQEGKILCNEALEKIAELNQKIYKLKSLAIKAQKACNACKLQLSASTEKGDRLAKETKQRIDLCALLKTTKKEAHKKVNDEMNMHAEVLNAAEIYRVPTVSDFIDSVLERKILDRKIKMQNRKLSLAKKLATITRQKRCHCFIPGFPPF